MNKITRRLNAHFFQFFNIDICRMKERLSKNHAEIIKIIKGIASILMKKHKKIPAEAGFGQMSILQLFLLYFVKESNRGIRDYVADKTSSSGFSKGALSCLWRILMNDCILLMEAKSGLAHSVRAISTSSNGFPSRKESEIYAHTSCGCLPRIISALTIIFIFFLFIMFSSGCNYFLQQKLRADQRIFEKPSRSWVGHSLKILLSPIIHRD